MESPGKIRMGLAVLVLATLLVGTGACASAPGGGGGGADDAITVHVDNQTNRVVAVERVVASGAGQPVTVRVGMVRGGSQQTLTIPWHPSRLAHELLWFDGLNDDNNQSYRVEECQGEGRNVCAETEALHLPRGAEVSLLIVTRFEVTMYYQSPGS